MTGLIAVGVVWLLRYPPRSQPRPDQASSDSSVHWGDHEVSRSMVTEYAGGHRAPVEAAARRRQLLLLKEVPEHEASTA